MIITKYQINTESNVGVPVIELGKDERGMVSLVEMHNSGSVVHLCDGTYIYICVNYKNCSNVKLSSPTLAFCDDNSLISLSDTFGIPLDELRDLRVLEKEYRGDADMCSGTVTKKMM